MSRAPRLLTPELQERFLSHVRAGVPLHVAASVCGITPRAYQLWRRRGEAAADQPADERDQYDDVFIEFAVAMREAEAEAEARLVLLWSKAANTDWRAARDLLDRRFAWHRHVEVGVNARIEDATELLRDPAAQEAARILRDRIAALSGDVDAPEIIDVEPIE